MPEAIHMTTSQSNTDSPIETIPGLGPVRVNALKKAGWHNTGDLRKATLEDLCSVRGITEGIARRVLAHVNDLYASDVDTTELHNNPFSDASKEADEVICGLLQSEQADKYAARFAKQLGKMALFIERVPPTPQIGAASIDKIKKELHSVARQLTEAKNLKPKQQEKLADTLRAIRHNMKQLLASERRIR